MPYTTKQRQAILRCLERRGDASITAGELAENLRSEGCPVGLATIYHQHRDCFLLKCERCGRIRHVDCTQLQALYDHLEREHHFRINPRGTLLSGVCDQCAKEEEHRGEQ